MKFLEKPLLLSLASLLFLGVIAFLTTENIKISQECAEVENALSALEAKELVHSKQKKVFDTLSQQLDKSDPCYVEKTLEPLRFLEQERMRLGQLFENPASGDLEKKKEFLKSETANRLSFNSKLLRTAFPYNEILLEQKSPVQLNDEDLKKLLCLIEGVRIFPYAPVKEKPQLIIKELFLKKVSLLPYQNVFEMQMKILKREKIRHENAS